MVTTLTGGIALAAVLTVAAALTFNNARQKRNRENLARNIGLIEAKKNTLRNELHDLGLGIAQVQRYINALKSDPNLDSIRLTAQADLDKAIALKVQIEDAIDQASTDAQVDGFALGLEQARLNVRKARRLSSPDEEFNGDEKRD
jgi:hypothetical protein